MADAQLIIAC